MLVDGIEIMSTGDKIQISKTNSKEIKSYSSQVLDIINEDRFLISGPIHKKQLVILHKNEKINIYCIVKNKGIYSFIGEILRKEYNNMYILEIKKISNVKRTQQRFFFRLDIMIPIDKYYTAKDDDKEKTLIEECRIADISAGGLKLYAEYNHNVGDIITCIFNIDDYSIESKAKIVRIENLDKLDYKYKYEIGVEFIKLKEKDKDKIIKFIFSKQIELRGKGLI